METVNKELAESNLSVLNDAIALDSSLSFKYFLDYLRSMGPQNTLYNPFFSYVVRKFEEVPELSGPIKDLSILTHHRQLLKLLEATFFPPADKDTEHMFAFSTPWHFRPFHSSKKFDDILYRNIVLSDKEALRRFHRDKTERLFTMVLKKYYDMEMEIAELNIFPVYDPETKLTKYYHVDYDTRFCDIIAKGPLPEFDKEYIENNFHSVFGNMEFLNIISPENFAMEGFALIKIHEVTETAAVTDLKDVLLKMTDDDKVNYFPEAEKITQSLLGIPGLAVSLLPLFRINNHFYFTAEEKSLIGKMIKDDSNRFQAMEDYFARYPFTYVCSSVQEEILPAFLQPLKNTAVKSYLLSPLFRAKQLIGVLEMVSEEENALQNRHLLKLRPARVLLIQMVANHLQRMNDNIAQLIKNQFTSLQSSVEWKFREIAFLHYQEKLANPSAEMGVLRFEKVFPAFGSIDIRSSSLKRSEAIREDLIEQLGLTIELMKKLRQHSDAPILEEMQFRSEEHLEQVQEGLTIETEAYASSFLDSEVKANLELLVGSLPKGRLAINDYLYKTDKETGSCCRNRWEYEKSVSAINKTLSAYLEKEQAKLQEFYPHLFEKYHSDGIEYNIYIGQSIQPQKPFHPVFRRNLYLWQLNTMVAMARITHDLSDTLPVPLETTQLIMLYGSSINISFRKDERRFDVEDAYNIRYELLKKRIDKICIKGTGERLTQPGTIAIIYSRSKDAEVFDKYVRGLVRSGALDPVVEQLDLEDAQGVSGLKALRVRVRF